MEKAKTQSLKSRNKPDEAKSTHDDASLEQNIFKILNECSFDVTKYRKLIFYVGTSLDNKKLRAKIRRLQDKLFKTLLVERDTIIVFFKKSLTSSASDAVNKEDTERLVCFVLATLSYLESLVIKLSLLVEIFPTEKTDIVINLGYEDSTIVHPDEITVGNESQGASLGQEVAQGSTRDGNMISADPISRSYKPEVDETQDLKARLAMIQKLKEEIEHMDVNLIRYNVKKESEEFIKRIKEYNPDQGLPSTIAHDEDEDEEAGCMYTCCIRVIRPYFCCK